MGTAHLQSSPTVETRAVAEAELIVRVVRPDLSIHLPIGRLTLSTMERPIPGNRMLRYVVRHADFLGDIQNEVSSGCSRRHPRQRLGK